MKKYVCLFLALTFTTYAIANPDDAKKKYHVPKASKIINPKVGLMVSNITDAPASYKANAKVGLLIGSDFRFGKRLYFQPGLFYKQEGSVLIYNDGTVEQENNITKNSMCVKAQVGYYLVNKEGFRIRLNAGPSYDFAIKQKVFTTSGIPSNQDWLNSSALNLEAGAGLDIWFLSLDAGYTYGLGDAFRSGLFSNGTFTNSKLVGAYVSAGIVIPYQKK